MKTDEQIAGGFGIHYPYPDCNLIDKIMLKNHFRNFGEERTIFYIEDPKRYETDDGYRGFLSFFSDNNSCLRRKVWEQIPYDDVNFAEDQIWAKKVLEKAIVIEEKLFGDCFETEDQKAGMGNFLEKDKEKKLKVVPFQNK